MYHILLSPLNASAVLPLYKSVKMVSTTEEAATQAPSNDIIGIGRIIATLLVGIVRGCLWISILSHTLRELLLLN